MPSDRLKTVNRASIYTLVGNTLLALIKFVAGVVGQSSAMVSDGIHSFSDSFSTIAVMVGVRIADAPPDERHHYGHGRVETVTAKIVAILLIVTAAGLGMQAIRLMLRPELPEPKVIS